MLAALSPLGAGNAQAIVRISQAISQMISALPLPALLPIQVLNALRTLEPPASRISFSIHSIQNWEP
jgi:hypothetical protein